MANSTYTNDSHPDIAYLLVFNRFPLQARLCLRIVCQRWKNIIEADCSLMTTLKVFCNEDHWGDYIWRTQHQPVKSPTAKEPMKYESNRSNTIILKRPSYDNFDLPFLPRIFPAVQNLALAWQFGDETADKVLQNQNNAYQDFGLSDAEFEPDIFGLLSAWAPNLRELYLVTLARFHTYWNDSTYYQVLRSNYELISLEDDLLHAFWQCLTRMAPTLQKLTLYGVDLRSAPESLTFPLLEEMSYYVVPNFNTSFDSIIGSDQLHNLAPVLRTFRLPKQNQAYSPRFSWDCEVPSTVSRMAVHVDLDPDLKKFTPCPSITHLDVQLRGSSWTYKTESARVLPTLLRKFPNTKSLSVEGRDFPRWLTKKGEEYNSLRFLAKLALGPTGPLDGIEELYLSSFTNYIFVHDNYKVENANYDLIFCGISATFKGLKKLTLAIGPDTEKKHRAWYKKLAALKCRYLPNVEVAFVLEIDAGKRELAFKGGAEYVESLVDQCFFSSRCVFVSQAEEPQVKEAINTSPNKKQRIK